MDLHLNIFIKPVSFTDSVFNEHRIEIKINGSVVDTLVRNNFVRFDTTVTFSSGLLANNTSNNVSFRYIPLGNQYFYPVVFIDFFELSYPRDFVIRNNNLLVTLSGTDSTSKKIGLTNFNPGNEINIYDINNYIRIENYSNTGNVLTYTGKSNSSFIIVNEAITKKPFRIIQRQVGDLVSPGNAADYLIVYNKLFESPAQQLKDHRASFDKFRSFKAEIQDIYDVFNYGIEDPAAVRYFVKHVYDNWQIPKVKYLCLFGRASLDPKKNAASSEYYQNFVPTYGNPPSDGYFANFNIGTFTYYHQISVGRIPVYNLNEAQNAVSKIINYDLQPPDKWWKKYIAITGGGTRQEQLTFQSKSNYLINTYMTPSPVSLQVAKIYRNDSTGFITFNYKDSIKKDLDRGALIVNFIGHAAAQDWEIGMENPNSLNNGNRQPLVMSFTCYTGKNSEPNFRSFGENFFNIPNKCAIGFLGSTGWSFSGIGDSYNEHVLKNFSKDSARRIGDLVSYASERLGGDSTTFSARNTVNCYNLIGDPATSLLMPNKPEFEIKQDDTKLSNPFPAIGEIIKLTVFPKNLGTYVDTCEIKFQIRKNGAPSQRKDTLIRTFGYIDTLDYFLKIDSIGNYTITVVMDPNRKYSQEFTNNDSVTFALTLRNLSYVQVKPLDNALLVLNTFKFTGLNPNVNPRNNSVKVILQIDTVRSFDSPVLQMYNNNNISGVTTSFNVTIPVLDQNTLYYIRTNAVINNDSSGWSAAQRVIYNPEISDIKQSVSDSAYTIYSSKPGQFEEPDLYNLYYSPEGFRLNQSAGNFYVKSFGSNGAEASYFLINDVSFYSDGGGNPGLNIARVRKFNGLVRGIKNFRMNSPQSSDSVLSFLNTFDSTDYLLSYIAAYVPDGDSLREDAKAKFREFGSVYVDSITYNFFDTWVLIGSLDSLICEDAHPYRAPDWIPSICEYNPVFQNSTGRISQIFGPADRWKSFSWTQTLVPNSSISFDIFGVDRDNVPIALISNLTNNTFVNIDTIDYYTYPNLRLDANIKIDSAEGFESPVFNSTNFKYIPPAELIPDNNSITGTDTLVQEGDSVSFSISYYNVGYIDAPAHVNKWYLKDNSGEIVLKTDTVNAPLQTDSMGISQITFSTTGRRNPKLEIDTIDLFFETALVGNRNELFSYNNTAITKFLVRGDTLGPLMEVTYDGINILNGDFIQSKPNIVLKFFDDSRMVINDTSNIKVYTYINNGFTYVPYFVNGAKNPVIDITFPDNRFLQATVTYRPTLGAGEHKFRYVATDLSGNIADSILHSVIVDDNLRIHDMANYPNPLKTETNFMFKLSGEFNPTTCKVKIYTVAGRLVREINTPANVGYNNIHWDGKDNDGDFIANGVYLYKFIIQGDSQIETSIQKLAVLR